MLDWKLLASPTFWFSLRWNPLTRETAYLMVAVFAIVLVVGCFVFWNAERKLKRDSLIRSAHLRIAIPLVVSGVLGLLLTFFAYQQIPVFSARFWFLLLFVYVVATEIFAVRNLLVSVPRKKSVQGAKAQWGHYFK